MFEWGNSQIHITNNGFAQVQLAEMEAFSLTSDKSSSVLTDDLSSEEQVVTSQLKEMKVKAYYVCEWNSKPKRY